MKNRPQSWLLPRRALAAVAVASASLCAPLATAHAGPDCSPASRANSIPDLVHFVETHPEVQKMLGDAWRQSSPEERRSAVEKYLADHPGEGTCAQ